MDPEGDCDINHLVSVARPEQKPWKRSMDPEGDCDFSHPITAEVIGQIVEKVDGP